MTSSRTIHICLRMNVELLRSLEEIAVGPSNKLYPILLLSMLPTSACTSLPTRVHDSGVEIESVSNDAARLRSVAFWTDRKGLSLHGEVLPGPSRDALEDGHVDISITVPDGSSTVCTSAELYVERSHKDDDFSRSFVSLPPRGSQVRVWYHAVAMLHDDCSE